MISFQNVMKSFGDKRVLNNLSFNAHPHRITGFVGANGAGKTTAMRILAGLLAPDSGSATIDGKSAKEFTTNEASFFLGADPLPNHMRVIDYLSYIADLKMSPRSDAPRLLEAVGLAHVPRIMIRECSLGMKQRVALAGALIGESRSLVLDEPVNGMDIEGVRWIRQYLTERAQSGCTVLLSSHLLSELELVADDVVILKDGVCICSGSINDLTTDHRPTLVVDSVDNARLAQHFASSGFSPKSAGNRVEISADSLLSLVQALAKSDIEIRSVSSATPTIEQFLFGK